MNHRLLCPLYGLLVAVSACRGREPESSPAEAAMPPVLGPEVGQAIEALIHSEAVRAKVPAGWTLDSVQIQARSIELKATGPQGATAVATLKPKSGAEGGRWFSYEFRDAGAVLKPLAEALDAGFESSPWRAPKPEGVPAQPGENSVSPPLPAGVGPTPVPAAKPAESSGAAPAVSPGPAPAPAPTTPSEPTAPAAPAPVPAAPAQPHSQSRSPAWVVLASSVAQVILVLGAVVSVLRDELRGLPHGRGGHP